MFTSYRGGQGKGLMRNVGDLAAARNSWLLQENKNFDYLLHLRYSWMNDFIPSSAKGLEIGSGIGASKQYLKSDLTILISDNNENGWLDIRNLDARKIKNCDQLGLDFVIANNVIHHLAFPAEFIIKAFEVLPKDGKIIIQEIHTSLFCRIVLKLLRHEPFNEKANPFDISKPMSNQNDNWDANCSIPKLLFSDPIKFEQNFPGLKVSYYKYTETFLLLLSGGVTAKTWYPKLPRFLLEAIKRVDDLLCALAPDWFAFQMQLVIERTN